MTVQVTNGRHCRFEGRRDMNRGKWNWAAGTSLTMTLYTSQPASYIPRVPWSVRRWQLLLADAVCRLPRTTFVRTRSIRLMSFCLFASLWPSALAPKKHRGWRATTSSAPKMPAHRTLVST
jgi:hypothetical protein